MRGSGNHTPRGNAHLGPDGPEYLERNPGEVCCGAEE